MAVDYAKRGAPKKRKPAGKKQPPKRGAARKSAAKGNNPPPLRAIAVTAIVVAVFVAFLWFLKSDKNVELATGESGGVSAPPLEPLPEIPAERWQYIEELQTRQVEVEVPEAAEARRRLMQCGSFRNVNDADALRARIAMAGFESQVRESHGSNGRWYRVILGPFENLRAAQRTSNQLQRAGIHGCQIWLWNLD